MANLAAGPVGGAHAVDTPQPSKRLLPLAEVLRRVPVGRAYWYERVRDGRAPKPVKLGKRSLWVEAELDAWISALAEQRAG